MFANQNQWGILPAVSPLFRCAQGAGCNPVGCYGATVSKQASCPRTHGWITALVNYKPAPPPPAGPGMESRTVPQPTADKYGNFDIIFDRFSHASQLRPVPARTVQRP